MSTPEETSSTSKLGMAVINSQRRVHNQPAMDKPVVPVTIAVTRPILLQTTSNHVMNVEL